MNSPYAKRLFTDFVQFCAMQQESCDVDPVYSVLRALYQGLTEEQALWNTFVYVGVYHLPEALRILNLIPEPASLPSGLWIQTGIERRGFRGDGKTLGKHIASLLPQYQRYGSLSSFLTQSFQHDFQKNWRILQQTLQLLWGNGRWAAYKTGEILQKVHGFPVTPTDMGHAFSSGPRQGLALFYGTVEGNQQASIDLLDSQGEDLQRRLQQEGVQLGLEEIETMLCDFHALVHGRYYVGHDIDQLQGQIRAFQSNGFFFPQLWKARRDALPSAYLGELHGWDGVQQSRKKLYQQTGKVVKRG